MKRKEYDPNNFAGVYTATVTPFKHGKIDEPALGRLIQRQIKAGMDGIVAAGTTGEPCTLDFDEQIRAVKLSVDFVKSHESAKHHFAVIGSAGANNTREAIYLSQEIEKVGADALLHVAPYYNKPTQEGVFQHFRAVAKATKLPIILYSILGRCGIEIAVNTVERLAAECKSIIGIKEASGNPDRVSELRLALGPKFTIVSGDDSLTLPFMAVGANGAISVASNVIPHEFAQMVHGYLMGSHHLNDLNHIAFAQRLHQKFYPLFKALFIESNPGPVKAALAMMGFIEEEYRLPLVPMAPENRLRLQQVLEVYGLIKPHYGLPASRKRRGK